MFAFGIFYGRHGEETVAVEINDALVIKIVAAKNESEHAFEDVEEDMDTRGICQYVVMNGLFQHIREHGAEAKAAFVSDQEEWQIGYGSTKEQAKRQFEDAFVEEENNWEHIG